MVLGTLLKYTAQYIQTEYRIEWPGYGHIGLNMFHASFRHFSLEDVHQHINAYTP